MDPDIVFTVSVDVAPPVVGVLVAGVKENVASDGSPDTPKVSEGMIPVDPEISVSVIV